MRLKYDEKSVKRMQRPLLKRFVRESGEEVSNTSKAAKARGRPMSKVRCLPC